MTLAALLAVLRTPSVRCLAILHMQETQTLHRTYWSNPGTMEAETKLVGVVLGPAIYTSMLQVLQLPYRVAQEAGWPAAQPARPVQGTEPASESRCGSCSITAVCFLVPATRSLLIVQLCPHMLQ